MINRRRVWALAVALLMAQAASGVAQSLKVTNEFCPILPDRKAVPEFWSDYQGRRIYFCCEDCKQAFDINPAAVTLPPSTSPSPAAEGHVHGPGYAEWAALVGIKEGAPSGQSSGNLRVIVIGFFTLLLLGLLVARKRGVQGSAIPRQYLGLLVILALWSVPWAWAWRNALQRVNELEGQVAVLTPLKKESALNQIHFATFIDFGRPPRPKRPPVPPRLSSTYYRGNDERSDRLFNRGYYRTATFHISVRDEKGEKKAGDVLTGPVFIRLEIVRAPFTPDHFWAKDRLAQIYLTRDAAPDAGARAPTADRTPLVETEPTQRWQADYKLGKVQESTQGTIYVREQFAEGARFHFGLQYDLQIENGRLGKKSDLYMGFLYRTRNFSLEELPGEEWFSHLPIPVKPSAGTTDAKLLGIDVDSRPYRR